MKRALGLRRAGGSVKKNGHDINNLDQVQTAADWSGSKLAIAPGRDCGHSASTRVVGKVISTSVPEFCALLIAKLARLASTSALVKRQAEPGAAGAGARRTWRAAGTARARSRSRSRTCRRRCRAPATSPRRRRRARSRRSPGRRRRVNLIEFDSRLSTIWRIERASATTGGRLGASDVRMMMRSRLACGCIIATHWLRDVVEIHAGERQIELAGLDLGEVEQIVDQRDQVRAGSVNVLEIVPVALVADRPEALVASSPRRNR